MGRFQIEVIVWSVKVDRQEEDGIHTVLLTVRLALDQQRFFRDTIWRVGLLRVAVPQVPLTKRHRGELWIRADRPKYDSFLHSVAPGCLDDLDAHNGVLVEEASGVGTIGADSTHDRGQVNQYVGPMFRKQTFDCIGARKIVVGMNWREDIPAAHLL